MNFALNYLPGIAGAWNAAARAAGIFVALTLAACGGGSGSSPNTDPTASCDPTNPSTFDQCQKRGVATGGVGQFGDIGLELLVVICGIEVLKIDGDLCL